MASPSTVAAKDMIPRGHRPARWQSADGRGRAFHSLPGCEGWIDCRDLAQVLEHEGPLPHPVEDRPQ
jgi:hypothetical protein